MDPIQAIVIGISILFAPRFINYFVAAYMIARGVFGLMHQDLS
ncbi:MAG: DUF3096 domain-containing protein [Gammaproteobacteria bacterium]